MTRKPKKAVERLAPVADEILDQFGPAEGMSMEDIDGGAVSIWWGGKTGNPWPERCG